jgi:NAD(P)-dependent dehydrogenase (short-subunit alcohol dehydrogenase family)/acyl carrier protein
VAGEEWLCPGKATVLGPVKVIPREYSSISCRSLDIVLPKPGKPESKLIERLVRELETAVSDTVIAYRGNHRLVQAFEPVRLEKPGNGAAAVREGGVYLITGGLGGIGLTLAAYLAETVRARLILVSRTALPPRREWDSWLQEHGQEEKTSKKIQEILALEALGSEVFLAAADTADFKQMQGVITEARERFGPINGVIHAAGLPGGGVVQRRTRENTQPVLSPKVQGTLILDQLLQGEPLDFFILCSSQGSIIAPFGHVDYCAANAFLDAFAQEKTSRDGTLCVSINWGSWAGVGMASRAKQRLGNLLDFSTGHEILPGEGIEAFTRILANPLTQVVVSPGDFLGTLEQYNASPALELPESLWRGQPDLRDPASNPRAHPLNSSTDPGNQVEQWLADLLQTFFGIAHVGNHDNFFDLGATSLDLIQLNAQLKEKFKKTIPLEKLFSFPTIGSLARYLEAGQEEPPPGDEEEKTKRSQALTKGKKRLSQRKASIRDNQDA